MDIVAILEVVMKLIAVLFVGIISYLTPKIKTLIENKIGSEKSAQLTKLVNTFVKSAEQLYADEKNYGAVKKKYVEEQLSALGYVLTEEINALIESAVFNLK